MIVIKSWMILFGWLSCFFQYSKSFYFPKTKFYHVKIITRNDIKTHEPFKNILYTTSTSSSSDSLQLITTDDKLTKFLSKINNNIERNELYYYLVTKNDIYSFLQTLHRIDPYIFKKLTPDISYYMIKNNEMNISIQN